MTRTDTKDIYEILGEKMRVILDRFEEPKEYTKLELLNIVTNLSSLRDKEVNELSSSLSRIQKICGMKPTIE